MFKNYFKLGWRNLKKNKLSSIINIVGLSLAVGCCLVVFVFFDWSINQDNFHSKLDKLYVVERITEKDGNQQLWGDSPSPMGAMLKNDFPQIKNTIHPLNNYSKGNIGFWAGNNSDCDFSNLSIQNK